MQSSAHQSSAARQSDDSVTNSNLEGVHQDNQCAMLDLISAHMHEALDIEHRLYGRNSLCKPFVNSASLVLSTMCQDDPQPF